MVLVRDENVFPVIDDHVFRLGDKTGLWQYAAPDFRIRRNEVTNLAGQFFIGDIVGAKARVEIGQKNDVFVLVQNVLKLGLDRRAHV